MSSMRASGTFKVVAFTPPSIARDATTSMEKRYEGDLAGRSATLFATALDESADVGTHADIACACVALESFEGTIGGRDGAFEFSHWPTTAFTASADVGATAEEFFRIVPTSGTGLLAGIHGTGGMAVDADGTHRIWFDYELG